MVADAKDTLQKTFKHWLNSTYALIWRQWTEMVQEKKEQRSNAGRAVTRMRMRLVVQTFEVCAANATRRTPTLVRAHGRLFTSTQAWVASVREAIEEREQKMMRTAAIMTNSSVARAFRNWSEVAGQGRKVHDLQRRTMMRLHHGALFSVYEAWADYVSTEVYTCAHRIDLRP